MTGNDESMDDGSGGSPAAAAQDHSECERRISELQDELNCKDAELAVEVDRVQLLSQTVKDLRDALSKKDTGGGIRPSLDARLQQLGFTNSPSEDAGSSAATANSLEIGGTLLDFSAGCKKHPKLKLSMVTANVPASALLWTAKSAYDLAQGLQVAESLQLSAESRALFFTNNSPLANFSSFEKPSDDYLVRVMVKLATDCVERQLAFFGAKFKQLKCSSADKADLKVAVAEKVRAELDAKKSLRSEPVLVLGGRNANFLCELLGACHIEISSLPDLRLYFENHHFQSAVQHVFIWLDIDHDGFKLAQQSQLVAALRDTVLAAAQWKHIAFVVLPVPWTASLLHVSEPFMQAFNMVSIDLPNVLWLNDSEKMRRDGARFACSLGSNDLVTDNTSVDRLGYVSSKGARAALRFVRSLKPALVPEHVDLSDPKKPEKPSTSSADLHEVRHGKVTKHRNESHRYDPSSARGAPFKRGGGGNRGQWNNTRRGQGTRRH